MLYVPINLFLTKHSLGLLVMELFCSDVLYLPNVASTWRSSAPITVPFPSLSKTRRPSTKSSNVPWSLDLDTCWNIGRKVSKSISLLFISRENGYCKHIKKIIHFNCAMFSLYGQSTVYFSHPQVWVCQVLWWPQHLWDSDPTPSWHHHTERKWSSFHQSVFCRIAWRPL